MNETLIKIMATNLNISLNQVVATLKLLSDGNTIPFIARYRKEATGSLDEEIIRIIDETYQYQLSLLKRKEDVIRLIDEKGMLNDELKTSILKCNKLVEVEDLYRPFKEKKKTKASEAIKNGLEPLAKIIMSFPHSFCKDKICQKFLNDQVKSSDDAINGAKFIIAEWISDNANYRKYLRNYTYNNGMLFTKMKKNAIDIDDEHIYDMYYDYHELFKYVKPHRILAINRGEKEGIINVTLDIDEEKVYTYLENKLIKDESSAVKNYVIDSIKDSYKRLIKPSIERELRSEIKDISEEQAINVFGKNLEKLLLQPPMKEKVVLGFDPAYRTGCKLAVIDELSRVLDISVIYPHEPKNEWEKSKKKLQQLVDQYKIDIIAIGNGTASRESEKLVAEFIHEYHNPSLKYIIVSEAGASVYSASKLAISEFPDLHVEQRSAISIARRLQDPLNELVKIDAKNIGVGLYQHDVSQKKLDESLNFVVTKAVNNVGVNVNSASSAILKYVSGLTKSVIDNILKYKEEHGKFVNRDNLKKVKGMSDKVYEQAIGFMRIIDGNNILDKTSIHPESYDKTINLLNDLNLDINNIGTQEFTKVLDSINVEQYCQNNDIDIYTLKDIITCLKQPNRDYRENYEAPLLKSDILHIEDLNVGMKLQGTVRNVVDFGAFIDIGLKNDGLVHISKMTDKYIKHPLDIVNVGDIVDCYVDEIKTEKKKVSLSFLQPNIK